MLFFQANDGTRGPELWRSNGTTAGTVMVKDIDPGSVGSNPKYLTNANGTLFFQATNGVSGPELWRSNGAALGTVLTLDIRPGSTGSNPANLTDVGEFLFFTADDGTHGVEPWVLGPLSTPKETTLAGATIASSTTSDAFFVTGLRPAPSLNRSAPPPSMPAFDDRGLSALAAESIAESDSTEDIDPDIRRRPTLPTPTEAFDSQVPARQSGIPRHTNRGAGYCAAV
jgi:ELWxxDGT repeat protein